MSNETNEVNKFDKMVKGVKVKRLEGFYGINWVVACKANGVAVDSVLTISSGKGSCISFDTLTGYKGERWLKKHFEIIEHAQVEEKKNTIKVGSKVKRKAVANDFDWKIKCNRWGFDHKGEFTVSSVSNNSIYLEEFNCYWCALNFELVEEQEPVANSEMPVYNTRDTHNLPEAILKQATVLAKAYEDYKRELDIHEELVKQLVAKEK